MIPKNMQIHKGLNKKKLKVYFYLYNQKISYKIS